MVATKKLLGFILSSIMFLSNFNKFFTSLTPWHDTTVMLVTAHPDDETMFFGPTLIDLTRPEKNNTVVILTLSRGDAEGLGEVRVVELYNAAAKLGIPPNHIRVINDPALPDAMDIEWDEEHVADIIAETASLVKPSYVVTFDKDGVSGHPNHKAIFRGVLRWALRPEAHKDNLQMIYTLGSVSLWRKYLFVCDAVLARLHNVPRRFLTVVNSNTDFSKVRNALVAHKSQMTWYRQLWSFFSRYMVVNDLGPINLDRVAASPLFTVAVTTAGSGSHDSGVSKDEL